MATENRLLEIVIEREVDGRWFADIPSKPGVMAYGRTRKEAALNALELYEEVEGTDEN